MADSHVMLYRAKDRIEASQLAHALASIGIQANLTGGETTSALGEVPITEALATELWVERGDYDQGREHIEALQAKRNEAEATPAVTWTCPDCAEANEPTFEVCWKCQASRR